jgi:signal transduction histidine kinase
VTTPRGREAALPLAAPSAEGVAARAGSASEAARLHILVDISRRLAEAQPDLESVLDTVASRVIEVLGDGCAAYLRSPDDTVLEPVTIRHREPSRRALIEQVNQARKLRLGEGMVGTVTASGETLFLSQAEPAVLRGLVVPEYLAYLERVGVHSLLVVPLAGKERVHGALWLARDPGSAPYTQEDRELIEAIADCAALALDSAQLHVTHKEDLRRLAEAASRTERLQEVTAALSSAVTPEEVAAVVANLAVASMDGVAGSLMLPNSSGTELEIVAHVGHTHAPHLIERFRRLPVAADNPAALAFRERSTVYFRTLESFAEAYPALRQAASEAGYNAAAALPLLARGEPLGVLYVRFATARAFDTNERTLMSTMVAQCAQALERSRLYTRAQKAVEHRDEFLSVAAHELRTPLTAMKLQVQVLQRDLDRPQLMQEALPRLASKAGAVARHVERLEALVNDLLDLSRLTAGKLALRLEDFDLLGLVREVRERMASELAHAGCTLTMNAAGPVLGTWDRARLDQVITNLLHNALKYGAGRPIEISASTDGTRALLAVRDGGIGISAEDHARIFERFERAVPGRHYSGFGVGLWICKQIIEALGGTIQVKSRLGEGSTFEVSLPCRGTP